MKKDEEALPSIVHRLASAHGLSFGCKDDDDEIWNLEQIRMKMET